MYLFIYYCIACIFRLLCPKGLSLLCLPRNTTFIQTSLAQGSYSSTVDLIFLFYNMFPLTLLFNILQGYIWDVNCSSYHASLLHFAWALKHVEEVKKEGKTNCSGLQY